MATWADLNRELHLWQAAGVTPTFWWRDDDAEAPSAELDRLLDLATRHAVPLHLAVVPKNVTSALSARLRQAPDTYVLQHGYAHVNNEPPGARASEVGEHRDTALQLQDLRRGWASLMAAACPICCPDSPPPGTGSPTRPSHGFPSLACALYLPATPAAVPRRSLV